MTQIPAGWYPDPDPAAPEPKGQRYWDGQSWTAHLQPAQGTEPPAAPQPAAEEQPAAYPGYGQQAPPYAPMTPYGTAAGSAAGTTPDGQELSGWWRRVVALVIDAIVVSVLVGIVGFAWVRKVGAAYVDFVGGFMDAAQSGGAQPSQTEFMASITGPILALTLLGVLGSFVYNVGLLKWRAATLGQMALGIKVRLREQPGPLSWGTVLTRWVGKQAYKLVGLVPVIGLVGSLYALLNYLWPLWDDKNQALHDKLAKTNVVRSRGGV